MRGELYEQALDIHFTVEEGGYLHTEKIDGGQDLRGMAAPARPLSRASAPPRGRRRSLCKHTPWLEFDVDDIEIASRELEERGYRLLVRARTEPWGQVVTRASSALKGLLVGVTVTPSMRTG